MRRISRVGALLGGHGHRFALVRDAGREGGEEVVQARGGQGGGGGGYCGGVSVEEGVVGVSVHYFVISFLCMGQQSLHDGLEFIYRYSSEHAMEENSRAAPHKS